MSNENLSGPERMIMMLMKGMGINPQEIIAKFQEPVAAGLAGIKSVDERLTVIEKNIAIIMMALNVEPFTSEVIENDCQENNVRHIRAIGEG